MYDYYFTFRSVTSSQSAVGVLERAGIRCISVRTPRHVQRMGCGYSVRVASGKYLVAREILVQAGVQFNRVYYVRPDGTWEEDDM